MSPAAPAGVWATVTTPCPRVGTTPQMLAVDSRTELRPPARAHARSSAENARGAGRRALERKQGAQGREPRPAQSGCAAADETFLSGRHSCAHLRQLEHAKLPRRAESTKQGKTLTSSQLFAVLLSLDPDHALSNVFAPVGGSPEKRCREPTSSVMNLVYASSLYYRATRVSAYVRDYSVLGRLTRLGSLLDRHPELEDRHNLEAPVLVAGRWSASW